MSVDNLFEKIKQSEKEAQNRKSALNELKQGIFTIQEKIKTNERGCLELKKDLNKKLKELSEEDYKVKVEDIQLEIYRQERQELERDVTDLKAKQAELSNIFGEVKLKLCSDIERVTVCYGLRKNGRQLRAEKYEADLIKLKEEEKLLLNEIQEYTEKKSEVDNLLQLKIGEQQQLDKIEEEKNKYQCQLDIDTEKTLQMENQHQRTRNTLDDNFESIQQEVIREKETATELELECYNLQKELQTLQQRNWQKSVQARRPPQRKYPYDTGNKGNCGQAMISKVTEKTPCFYLEEDLETVFSDSEEFADCTVSDQTEDRGADQPCMSNLTEGQDSSPPHGDNQVESQGSDGVSNGAKSSDAQPSSDMPTQNTWPQTTHKRIFRPKGNLSKPVI